MSGIIVESAFLGSKKSCFPACKEEIGYDNDFLKKWVCIHFYFYFCILKKKNRIDY